jgi:hypothetical protein
VYDSLGMELCPISHLEIKTWTYNLYMDRILVLLFSIISKPFSYSSGLKC